MIAKCLRFSVPPADILSLVPGSPAVESHRVREVEDFATALSPPWTASKSENCIRTRDMGNRVQAVAGFAARDPFGSVPVCFQARRSGSQRSL
jgi:hypothetical protein